jgi:hypothetical protein
MNDERDPLEAELEALRPSPPSPQLYRRIAERLDAPGGRPAWRRWAALAGGLAAAAALAVWLWPKSVPPPPPRPDLPPAPPPVAEADDSRPTLLAYRHAAAESPAALEALLDKHAARYAPSGPPAEQKVYRMSDALSFDITGGP